MSEQRHPLQILPLELWLIIIKRIPEYYLLQFRLACSTFNTITSTKVYRKYSTTLFRKAVENDNIDCLKCIHKEEPNLLSVLEMTNANIFFIDCILSSGKMGCHGFVYAARNGYLDMLRLFFEWFGVEYAPRKMDYAFVVAAMQGHLPILRQLHEWDGKSRGKSVMREILTTAVSRHLINRPLATAAISGHLGATRQIYKWSLEEDRDGVLNNPYYVPFRRCAADGHISVLRQLYAWGTDQEKPLMIRFRQYYPFRIAASRGNVDVVKQIYSWCPDEEKQTMILCSVDRARHVPTDVFDYFMGISSKEILELLYNWADDTGKKFISF